MSGDNDRPLLVMMWCDGDDELDYWWLRKEISYKNGYLQIVIDSLNLNLYLINISQRLV